MINVDCGTMLLTPGGLVVVIGQLLKDIFVGSVFFLNFFGKLCFIQILYRVRQGKARPVCNILNNVTKTHKVHVELYNL